jgi:hypothetical protein
MTLSITTFSIMTLIMMTRSITTFNMTTISAMTSTMTLSITIRKS